MIINYFDKYEIDIEKLEEEALNGVELIEVYPD